MSDKLSEAAALRLLQASTRKTREYADLTKRVAFVATSYDTAFEPIAAQVSARIAQLSSDYDPNGSLHWSLWIVDDLPSECGFYRRVLDGFDSHQSLLEANRLHCLRLTSVKRQRRGLKGRAILDGFRAALAADPQLDAVVYINLNLKVNTAYAASGIFAILSDRFDVAVGSRWMGDGGLIIGGGRLDRAKSRIFSRLARAALPPLRDFMDPNAPMKVFSRHAAQLMIDVACIEHTNFDCEWLLIAETAKLRLFRFPVVWVQRPGSKLPWLDVPRALYDVVKIRRRWKAGDLLG